MCPQTPVLDRQAGEERLALNFTYLHQITLAAGQDEAPYPAQIGLLGAQAVVPSPQAVAHLIQQLLAPPRRDASISRGVIHTPAQQLGNTTSIDVGPSPSYQVSD